VSAARSVQSSWIPIAGVAAAFALAHAGYLRLPPLGRDSWRAADGLGVGRSYCEEQAPFWLPRVDSRGQTSGITGMEFPLLNWTEGRLACFGFDQVAVARTLTLLFAVMAIIAIGFLAGTTGLPAAGWMAAAAFATSPLVWYYGVAIQPDVPAVALMLVALSLLEKGTRARVQSGWMTASAGAAALGILIKLPVIVFGLPSAVLVISRLGWRRALRDWRTWAYAAIALVPPAGWYRYAHHLQDTYGLQTFYLGESWRDLLSESLRPSLYTSVFVQKLFDAYAFPLLSAVAVIALLFAWRRQAVWVRGLAIASIAYVLLAGFHVEHHFYYGLPLVPVIAVAAGIALARWSDGPGAQSRLRRAVSLLIIVGAAVYGPYRVANAHWWPRAEDARQYEQARAALETHTGSDEGLALFSANDPTLFWWLHRHGSLAPEHGSVEWFHSLRPFPRAVALDRRVEAVTSIRALLAASFTKAGYRPIWNSPGLEVWVR
jgi:hypothetical protein